MFCLNNAGSEAIDKLSSARKGFREHARGLGEPRASARAGPARVLAQLQAEARLLLDPRWMDRCLRPPWLFPKRMLYWEIPESAKAGAA